MGSSAERIISVTKAREGYTLGYKSMIINGEPKIITYEIPKPLQFPTLGTGVGVTGVTGVDEKVRSRMFLKNEYSKSSGNATPFGVEFNLPPHEWSLPVDPSVLDNLPNNTAKHSERRGKMWLYSDIVGVEDKSNSRTTGSTKSNTTTEGGKSESGQVNQVRKELLESSAKKAGNTEAAKQAITFYKPAGFQFLWNPETINLQVNTSMDIVPDAGDRLRAVAGIFPSQEHLTFSLILDRTNDFACIHRAYTDNRNNPAALAELYKKYYKTGFNADIGTPYATKLKNLMEYGTMHDVEYAFRMINAGTLLENKQPVNPLGRETYDLGYLYPALTAVEFGPSGETLPKPLSYVGWLQSIGIKHIAFNTNMIPLRTEISFDLWIYTGFGLENKE